MPIDDTKHVQFSLHRVRLPAPRPREFGNGANAGVRRSISCDRILRGEIQLCEVDPARVDLVRLQDDIAQVGQGRIADRERERLGRGDVGVIAIRKLWHRELAALERSSPRTTWRRTADIVPSAWMLDGTATFAGRDTVAASIPDIVDVRPFVEVEVQLRVLRRTGAMAAP